MIDIAICDDDNVICSQVEHIILDYAARNFLKIDLSIFNSGESLLKSFDQEKSFDLIFLDIELGCMNGVEAGRQIRKVLKNYNTEIVYISGKDAYDRQLFDIQPLHFIPKPINPLTVIEDLKLAIERTQRLGGYFTYQKGYDTHKIPINEIIYFESLNRENRIVFTTGEDFFYGKLEDTALSVTKYQFVQIHRSYLINYNHIAILRYTEVVMSNGTVLPISRSKRHEFRKLQISEE